MWEAWCFLSGVRGMSEDGVFNGLILWSLFLGQRIDLALSCELRLSAVVIKVLTFG